MQKHSQIRQGPGWILFALFMLFLSPSLSLPRTSEAGEFCGPTKDAVSGSFIPKFISLMDEVSTSVRENLWGAHAEPIGDGHLFALGQCYGDLSKADCSECYSESKTKLLRCLPTDSGRIYLDGCFLRYDNYNFFTESVNSSLDKVKCGPPMALAEDTIMKQAFSMKVEDVVSNVTKMASRNDGFAVLGEKGGVEGVYALAQCWKTLDEEGCSTCLRSATSKLKGCEPSKEGRALFAGCYLRYSTERFYNLNSDSAVDDVSIKLGFVIAGVLSATSLFILALFGVRLGYKRPSKKKGSEDNLGCLSVPVQTPKFNFKYEILEKATNNFDESRKLGQGGAGSVFKGILPDGRVVAVKRLFFSTRQWADEFFNEVNLIGGIRHTNLVKLLGCSIEGPESLLIYEYVPNRSLHQILFARNTAHNLSWQQRFNIICGIAEGLAYLHGGCGVKIIHRDIKSSNILLDEHLTPKIADFGLARCLAPDKTHISTGIAGTLGYLAPEYLVQGQLTEKADVYAFGVLVIEISCGRKNNAFTQGSSSVLHSVWKNYKASRITVSVDSVLHGCFPEGEAANVLQIGLLCTQASVALRPSMAEVVQMLINHECSIPSPMQPPFLNASVLSVDDTTGNSNMSNVVFNGQSAGKSSSFHSAKSTTEFYDSLADEQAEQT